MPIPEALNNVQQMAKDLYEITVTDAWYPGQGGNIQVSSKETQKHSMNAVLAGIASTNGRAPSKLGGRHITQSVAHWTEQGHNTLRTKKGVCTDCAAAAAVRFLELHSEHQGRVEIISSTTHAFVVINREGDIDEPENWGENCFVIDVWYQNQFAPNKYEGAFGMDDTDHPVVQFIHDNAARLRVEVCFREGVTEPITDVGSEARVMTCMDKIIAAWQSLFGGGTQTT